MHLFKAKIMPAMSNEAPSDPPREAAEIDPLVAAGKLRVWKSEDLLDGRMEAIILHDGQVYRLRCTRQGKLILNK
jgi:hemin uptake protein HemP